MDLTDTTEDSWEICTFTETLLKTKWDILGYLNRSGCHCQCCQWTAYSNPIYCKENSDIGTQFRIHFFFLISFWIPLRCLVILICIVIFLFWLNTGKLTFFSLLLYLRWMILSSWQCLFCLTYLDFKLFIKVQILFWNSWKYMSKNNLMTGLGISSQNYQIPSQDFGKYTLV